MESDGPAIILDASVMLAVMQGEVSAITILPLFEGAVMSAANVCEVYTKASEFGLWESPRVTALLGLLDRIEPFTAERAHAAAGIRQRFPNGGLSMGDRACLGLAVELGAVVYTADKSWSKVQLACKIVQIR